jgi:ABC-type multidrug transport system ATPase subunit
MGQKVSLYRGLTIGENVEFYAGLYGITPAALGARWGALRERFGLGEAEREKPEDLPAGIRQRAGLALATLHQPPVLFLDEPTAGVDVESRGLFWDVIQDEAAHGVTVFVTTHFLEEVDYCDWVSFIDAGKLVANATPEDLRRRFSPGYRVDVVLPEAAREPGAQRLGALGLAGIVANAGGFSGRATVLDPPLLGALAAVTASSPEARVHIEQPPMTDVFRRVIAAEPAP